MITYLLASAIRLTVAITVSLCVFRTFWEFLSLALSASARVLGPRRAGVPDPRIPHIDSEPAHRAYWSHLMWLDARSAVLAAWAGVRHRLMTDWLGRVVMRLLRGQQPTTGLRYNHPLRRVLTRVVAPGTALGAALGALLATLVVSLVFVVLGILLCLALAAALTAVTMLRVTDRVGHVVRSIRMKCPYPGCYRPFPLAVHQCPSCGRLHRELRPGRYGAMWHVCACGRRLVSNSLAGRDRLTTLCPHCDQQLPAGIGALRTVHVPLVGGTSSGKTMLMAAAVAGLHFWSGESRLKVEYASTDDRRDAVELNVRLNGTGWALKTQGGHPRAFMLRLTYGRRRRLLYLYDPMGESLRDAAAVREQQYLAHADGIILVTDVLADPQVRRTLALADAERADAAHPSEQGPLDTYQRLTGELAALTGRRRRLPVATVVTKRDALDRIDSLRVPATGVDSWLVKIGLGALVRGLGHDFGATRFWSVSSFAATGVGALDSEQRRAAEPVLWILSRSGLRVGALLARTPPPGAEPVDVPGPRDEAVRDRSSS
ncbi:MULTISPECIES: hypothetical protein [unclassified Streptomyces]|uniref:TRAFAC clade GTPase domain-containing protein n=1 Tax=unclassified Streptomyces TaxID=2593676 RepID=UPI00224D550C|nr:MULTISPECIES: hypothetical protein [unclassified Streptomyces]MCX4392944.1 hypothetical protein [Streptomyces sp. NBC_01767]WSC26943.1 hypothetical protein OG902_09715 [Streptomyces sp. NBC_01768]